MPRQSRKKSESGIYHIMLRGINKQQIFFDAQDYKKFIQILIDCKEISKFELYAYCLMDNHIHLLMKENEECISDIMKRIGCKFVYWYNAKYHRVGHLFQDRFRSEPVETDEYFLSVLRYIHNNPVKANMVRECSQYEYSSYNWYYERGMLVDKTFALSLININRFESFHQIEDKNVYMDVSKNPVRVTDEMAQSMIKDVISENKLQNVGKMSKEQKKETIKQLKQLGLSSRQIIMHTGLPKNMVEKVKL